MFESLHRETTIKNNTFLDKRLWVSNVLSDNVFKDNIVNQTCHSINVFKDNVVNQKFHSINVKSPELTSKVPFITFYKENLKSENKLSPSRH